MTFVESRSFPFVFIPPWGNPSCAFGAALLQGPTHRADSPSFPFTPPRGSILRLWRGPSPRAYSWSGFTLFSFHSASRIHPAPLARPFSKGLLIEQIHSLFLSFRFEDPSCAFGAALLQGPTHRADSLSFPFIPPRGSILRLWRAPSPRAYSWSRFTLFSFYTASRNPSCAFGAVLFQGPTHGADSLSFPFIPLRGSILRLWRALSSRGYSISKTPFFHLTPVTSH